MVFVFSNLISLFIRSIVRTYAGIFHQFPICIFNRLSSHAIENNRGIQSEGNSIRCHRANAITIK